LEFLENIDQGAVPWFRLHHTPWLEVLMNWLTMLGDEEVLYTVVIAAVIVLLFRRRLFTALLVAATSLYGLFLKDQVKMMIGRERPGVDKDFLFPNGHVLLSAVIYMILALALASRLRRPRDRVLALVASLLLVLVISAGRLYLGVPDLKPVVVGWFFGSAPHGSSPSFSFPSGHALLGAAIYVTLALVLADWLRRPRERLLVVAASLLLVLGIGASRLYLGVHYVMDVAAGWLAGLGLALLGRWLDEPRQPGHALALAQEPTKRVWVDDQEEELATDETRIEHG